MTLPRSSPLYRGAFECELFEESAWTSVGCFILLIHHIVLSLETLH